MLSFQGFWVFKASDWGRGEESGYWLGGGQQETSTKSGNRGVKPILLLLLNLYTKTKPHN